MSKKKREHQTFDKMTGKRGNTNFRHANSHSKGGQQITRRTTNK